MKLILHTEPNPENISERRLLENFALSYNERMKKAFDLMKLSLMFKNGPLKSPQAKGIVLKMK